MINTTKAKIQNIELLSPVGSHKRNKRGDKSMLMGKDLLLIFRQLGQILNYC